MFMIHRPDWESSGTGLYFAAVSHRCQDQHASQRSAELFLTVWCVHTYKTNSYSSSEHKPNRNKDATDPIRGPTRSLYQPINVSTIRVALIRNHCSEHRLRQFIHQYEIKQQPLSMGLLSWVNLYWNQFICAVWPQSCHEAARRSAWGVCESIRLAPIWEREREREVHQDKRRQERKSTNWEITSDSFPRKRHLSQIKLSKWKERRKSNSPS